MAAPPAPCFLSLHHSSRRTHSLPSRIPAGPSETISISPCFCPSVSHLAGGLSPWESECGPSLCLWASLSLAEPLCVQDTGPGILGLGVQGQPRAWPSFQRKIVMAQKFTLHCLGEQERPQSGRLSESDQLSCSAWDRGTCRHATFSAKPGQSPANADS